jgi:ATP-dependent RNA helicase DHX57
MGKAKGKPSSSKGKESSSTPPKCACDHPFNCDCGNRPPRPSRGHKWDAETQQWGGKGHNQKGASGQSRVVGEQALTTAVGQTQVAQWQKLPSALLCEFCQKQKRPPPKFKELLQDQQKTKFKVRCIVPDAKDPEKDLFLVPAKPVGNEEQAKEEAALLALLQLTPNIPHERKLPEPYKTTWLTAIQASKAQEQQRQQQQQQQSAKSNTSGDGSSATNHKTTSTSANKATTNTNLVLGTSHISAAERRRQQEERKRERNARIRRHENIRMANRDHPVFLSAKLRQQIQHLLQGDIVGMNPAEDDDDDDGHDENSPELLQFATDRQQYVEERLNQEGFTKRQARKAFEQLSASTANKNNSNSNSNNGDDDEEEWERFYDECLQWLCVHLPEDQLPEGFDPRGQTLEVVAHGGSSSNGTTSQMKKTVSGGNAAAVVTPEAQQLVAKYGLVPADATWLLSRASSTNESVETVLWNRIVELGQVSLDVSDQGGSTGEQSSQTLDEEMEALEAMFPEGLSVEKNGRFTTIAIPTPEDLTLTITLDNDSYPALPPKLVLCSGTDDWSAPGVGVAFHVELVKFLYSMAFGEPMIFEIFSQVQMLQQSMDELPNISLSGISHAPPPIAPTKKVASDKTATKASKSNKPRAAFHSKRPRERGVFWSTHPSKAPAATAFPKLSTSLQMQRRGLPAGKAREDFLSILREADKVRRRSRPKELFTQGI